MTMKVEMIHELVKDCKTKEDIFDENGLIKRLVKSVVECALQGELMRR